MKCPAEIYQASPRPYQGLPDIHYPFHDRTIVVTLCGRIPQGNSYLFLDTTSEVAPFGLLLSGTRDRDALVIPAEGPATLIRTPADPPQTNSERFQMEASLDLEGTLDGKTRFENHGDSEVALRAAYRNTPQNRWTELTQSIMSSLGYGGAVSEVSASQPEKLAEAFWVEYKYHRPQYSDWKDHQISLPFPPIFLPDLNEAQKKSKEPLPLGSPQDLWYETSIKMPRAIQPMYPPSDITQKTGFAEYTATYTYENGVLKGKRHLIQGDRWVVAKSSRSKDTSVVKSSSFGPLERLPRRNFTEILYV